MSCSCFQTSRIDGVGSWGDFFTGIGSFLQGAVPVVAPIVGGILPSLLAPSPSNNQSSGSRLEPTVSTTQQAQAQDKTYLFVGVAAVAVVGLLLLNRRRR
jgi:hypothetical protein